jgi:hypothetical protein
MKRLLAILALVAVFSTAGAATQEVGGYPTASPLTGSERMLSDQSGITVDILPAQIVTYFVDSDAVLSLLPSPLVNGYCLANNGTALVWQACSSAGTVTSVGLVMPAGFTVAGSPVTSSGALTVSTTLSGVIKGTGSGLTTAAASDIGALFSGCSGNTILLGSDGACHSLSGGGSVTSVGLSAPSWLTVSGSPVTSSGTLTLAGATGLTAHQVIGTGTAGTLAPLSLTLSDLPSTLTTFSGSLVSGHCAQWSTTTGNLVDSGAGCGAGGSSAFSALTSSTNTTAAMLVGTGASLGPTGSGTITANALSSGIALGTPASGTLTNATGLPVGGLSGLGTGVATFLGTPSATNLGAAVTGAGLVAGTNVTITGTWPNQTITASSTGATAFSALTGATNTTAAMLVGTGASLGPTGTGTVTANAISGNPVIGVDLPFSLSDPSAAANQKNWKLYSTTTSGVTTLHGAMLDDSLANPTDWLQVQRDASDPGTCGVAGFPGYVACQIEFLSAVQTYIQNDNDFDFSCTDSDDCAGASFTATTANANSYVWQFHGPSSFTSGVYEDNLFSTSTAAASDGAPPHCTGWSSFSLPFDCRDDRNGNSYRQIGGSASAATFEHVTGTTSAAAVSATYGSTNSGSVTNIVAGSAANTQANGQPILTSPTTTTAGQCELSTTTAGLGTWGACSGGGSSAFSALTSGTNTTAAMLVGTGSSLGATGSGTIAATSAPLSGLSGLGTSVATALAVNVGTAGSFAVNGGALGTPASGVATNLTGTAASLTAGTATVANGLKSATTTVAVSSATAPTTGQVLTATSTTAATWQTPTTGSGTVNSGTLGQLAFYGSTGTAVSGTTNASITAGALSLGASGTAGSVALGNATSGTVTIAPVTGALGSVTASLPANTGTIAELNLGQTFSAGQVFSQGFNNTKNGASNSTATAFLGTPFSGGTGTTTVPLFMFSAGTNVTTWNTAGTFMGFNGNSGFAGYFLDFHVNGGASVASLDASGNLTVASCTGCGGGGSSAFSALTGGTNTAAAMLVGSGASLGPTGTGTLNSNEVNGATVPASQTCLASNSSGQLIGCTTTGTLAFSAISGATNTSAAMVVGSGASLTTTGNLDLLGSSTGFVTLTTSDSGASNFTGTFPANTGTVAELNLAQTFSATQTLSGLTLSGITGSTQCLHVSTSGVVSGFGADCGGGITLQTNGTNNASQTALNLIAGTNITLANSGSGVTITASSTGATAFSALTSATNTTAAMLVGTGATLGTTGTGTITANAVASSLTSLPNVTSVNGTTIPASASLAALAVPNTWSAAQTFPASDILIKGSSTGTTALATANASTSNFTATFPAATDTVVELAATQTLTNKSIAATEVNSGTLAAAQMPALTGDVTTTSGTVATTVVKVNGGAVPTSAAVVSTNSSGQLTAATTVTYLLDEGTTFTLSSGSGACATTTTLVGGTTVGSFVCSGTTGASSIVVNLPTAPNSTWICKAVDKTTPANTVSETTWGASSATLGGTITSGDVVGFSCMGS